MGSAPTRPTGPASTCRALEQVGRPPDDLRLTPSGTVAAGKLTSLSQFHMWRPVMHRGRFLLGVAVLVTHEARRPCMVDPVGGRASQAPHHKDLPRPVGRPPSSAGDRGRTVVDSPPKAPGECLEQAFIYPGRFPFPQDGTVASLASNPRTGNAVNFRPLRGG